MNRRTNYIAPALAAGAMFIAAFVGVALLRSDGDPVGTGPSVAPHGPALPPAMRTVFASTDGFEVSQPGQALHTLLTSGTAPAEPTPATVLTDENCAPDAQGISHCTNRMRFDDGGELAVVHAHRMGDVPCLSPGERVLVQAA